MKKNTHPTYHQNAKVKCACGNQFTVGSTKPEINVEICYSCHPFYTGKAKVMDIAGRVEKFKARTEKKNAKPVRKKIEKKTRKKIAKTNKK
ncbi:MAG: 50S ribosomal protein L31 [Patescibacteria group bacterium]|nr:50S ribosomal protein L31 [Patescibacteria group bacterium]